MSEEQTKSFEDELNETVAQFVKEDEGGEMQAPENADAPADDKAEAPAVEAEAAPEAEDKAEKPADKAEPEAKPAEQDKPQQPQGDKTAALRAARRAEKQARQEIERLKEQLANAAKGITPESDEFTPEEIESMKTDFPAQYKLYLKQKAIETRIAAERQTVQAASSEFEPVVYAPEVQEIIDAVPDLLDWQHDPASQDKFTRAIEYDKALQFDPDWKDKPITERFAEAAERTKRAFGQAPTPKPAAPAAKPRTDPAAALANAPTTGPKGISDFGGGSPASAPAVDYSQMSNEEILARLPVLP